MPITSDKIYYVNFYIYLSRSLLLCCQQFANSRNDIFLIVFKLSETFREYRYLFADVVVLVHHENLLAPYQT